MKEAGKIYYHGTDDEIRMGDKVIIKRWIFPNKIGFVCYVPGQSDPNPQMHEDGLAEWAIQTEDGVVISWPFLPDKLQPSKRISLVTRNYASATIDPKAKLQ